MSPRRGDRSRDAAPQPRLTRLDGTEDFQLGAEVLVHDGDPWELSATGHRVAAITGLSRVRHGSVNGGIAVIAACREPGGADGPVHDSTVAHGSQARRGVVDVITYRVIATRDTGWWSLVAIDVEGREVASQARRLEQAETAIREAIALVLDVDDDAFEVDITPDLSHIGVSGGTLEALELTDRARRQTPAAVAELRQAGLTVRDVAQLLGVTPSRVSQIEKQAALANSAQRPEALHA
jgi:hypothetical protein